LARADLAGNCDNLVFLNEEKIGLDIPVGRIEPQKAMSTPARGLAIALMSILTR